MRQCSRCKKYKAASAFNKSSKLPDGLQRYCRECQSEKKREWARNNRERVTAYNKRYYHGDVENQKRRVREYYAQHAEERKAYRRYHYFSLPDDERKKLNRERYLRNPQQQKLYAQKWRSNNRVRVRERARAWARRNKDKVYQSQKKRQARIVRLPNTLTEDDKRFALDYFNDCCAVCGRPSGDGRTIVLDHWIPLSYEGDNPGTTASNCIPLCHGLDGCNNKKFNRLPEEWLKQDFPLEFAEQKLVEINSYFRLISQAGKDAA